MMDVRKIIDNCDEKKTNLELNYSEEPFSDFINELTRELDERLQVLQIAEGAKREFLKKIIK